MNGEGRNTRKPKMCRKLPMRLSWLLATGQPGLARYACLVHSIGILGAVSASYMKTFCQFFCLMEKTSVTGDDVAEGVCEILMNAEAAVCEELNNALSVRTPVFVYTLLSVHCYLF